MSDQGDNPSMGDLGNTRERRTRDRDGRLNARALQQGWITDPAKLAKLREEVENVVLQSVDDRAKVAAYRAIMEGEIAAVNSINQLAALENSSDQDREVSEDESDDPETFD